MLNERELLPDLVWAADDISVEGQQETVRLSARQLVLLTAACLFSSFDADVGGVDWPKWLAAVLFALTALVTVATNRRNPQDRWYEGRAVAESVKTLAWKYAVRAEPFAPRRPGPHATGPYATDPEALYQVHLAGVLQGFARGSAFPAGADGGITPGMRWLRSASVGVRRDMYLRERVQAQHDWYTERALRCLAFGRLAGGIAVALPALGMCGAVSVAIGWLSIDALGLVSAVTASVAAWAQLRQYRPLATAYRLAADELELIRVQLVQVDVDASDAEEAWSRLAREVEETVSREHKTWQARRELRG